MESVLEEAINCSDGDCAIKIIQDALGINPEDMARYQFPKTWPLDRKYRARIIGDWLQSEALFLARWAPPICWETGTPDMLLGNRCIAGD